MRCHTYLAFNGNCEEAMNFYKDVLGGEIEMMNRFTDMPPEVCIVPDEAKNLVMHCTLNFSGCVLMGSDTIESDKYKQGNNSAISINTGEEEAYAIFNGLSQGGTILMPFEDAFWGGKFGMVHDRFGVQWMVTSEHKPS